MDKELVLAKIKKQGIVAVVRGKDEQDGVRIADACIAGGVKEDSSGHGDRNSPGEQDASEPSCRRN